MGIIPVRLACFLIVIIGQKTHGTTYKWRPHNINHKQCHKWFYQTKYYAHDDRLCNVIGMIESFVAPIGMHTSQSSARQITVRRKMGLILGQTNHMDGVSEPSSLLTMIVSTMDMVRSLHPRIFVVLFESSANCKHYRPHIKSALNSLWDNRTFSKY